MIQVPPPIDDVRVRQSRRVDAWGAFFVSLILIGLIGVLGRVVQLKVRPDARLALASGSTTSALTETTRRGRLLDRRGRVIAVSTLGHRLFVDPQVVEDPFTIAVDLAGILGTDPIRIDKAISRRPGSRYVVVDHLLEPAVAEAIEAARLPGVGLEPRLVRRYPHGDVGRGLIGLVGFEQSGLAGFEHQFEGSLREAPGQLTYLRDARRRAMWISPADYRPGRAGRDVHLSIDLMVQEIAERHLAAAVDRQNAGGGRLVVADCRTGEILAMTDVLTARPGWDEQTDDPARRVEPALGRNRCVTDPYEPGSTFKPFVWAVATQLGKAHPDATLPTPARGAYRTSLGRRIRDSHSIENADWNTVLVHSLNSGMAIVAERMTDAEMQEAIRRFGFGTRTNCGIPGESPGIVTAPDDWTHYTQTSVSMGHEIAVTPVQMVRAFCALSGNGTMPVLRVTAREERRASRGDGYRVVRRVLPESLVRTVRRAMRDVVERGRAGGGRYEIFGKSGTAQLPRKEGGGYHEDRYVSSFIAAGPYRDSRVVVLCVLDDPDRSRGHYGSVVAGPVVRDVIDETLAYMGVAEETSKRRNVETAQALAPAVAVR